MAVINGSSMLLLIGDIGNATALGCAKSCTLTIDVDTPDASCKSSGGWADSILGQISWNVSFDGLYDPDGVTNFNTLYDNVYEKDDTLIMELAEIDGTGGGTVFRGNILISSLSLTPDMETPTTYSGSFKGKGRLYRSTVASS
jgi:predicted secreted protein